MLNCPKKLWFEFFWDHSKVTIPSRSIYVPRLFLWLNCKNRYYYSSFSEKIIQVFLGCLTLFFTRFWFDVILFWKQFELNSFSRDPMPFPSLCKNLEIVNMRPTIFWKIYFSEMSMIKVSPSIEWNLLNNTKYIKSKHMNGPKIILFHAKFSRQ